MAETMDRKRLLWNAAISWAGFSVQLVVAFLLAPVLVHGLGDSRYGVWSLVESVLAYLLLFDLGVAASVVRYVARFQAHSDHERLNAVFSTSVCLFAVAGGAALAVALGTAVLIPFVWAVPAELRLEAQGMMVLLGANLAMGLPCGVFPCVLDGLECYSVKTVIRTLAVLVRSGLFLIVVRHGGGLIALAWTITLCNLVEHLAMAVAAWRCLPALRFALRLVTWDTFRTIRGYSIDAFLALVAGRISFQTDALVIGAFLAPSQITFFALAARLTEQAKSSLRAATTVLRPAISGLDARGEQAAIRRTLIDGTRWVLYLILPVQAAFLFLGHAFLHAWIGPQHAMRCYPTLAILSVPLGLAMSQSVSGHIFYGLGKLHWFARATLAEAFANLVLSVALVVPLGIEGVALGTAIPNVVFNLAVASRVCREVGVGLGAYARRSFAAPLLLVLPLGAAWAAAALFHKPGGWATLFVIGGGGMVTYLATAACIELGPRCILDAVNRAARRLVPGSPVAPEASVEESR